MTEPRMTGSKICSKCHEDKPVLAFSVKKTNKDGLESKCRDCRRTEELHSNHYKSRKEKVIENRQSNSLFLKNYNRWKD